MHRLTPVSRLHRALAGAALGGFLAVAAACGGGSEQAVISEAEAREATNSYLMTTLGLFTGAGDPQAFIEQYAPECRQGVDASALAFVATFMQALAPGLAGVEIEGVDAGALSLTEGEGGVLVTPLDSGALRVQVEGRSVPAAQFFSEAGFVPTETGFGEPILLVRRDGAVYLGDCEELKDLTGGLGGS